MNKTYAITDLHGQYELWEQIKNYCDETDTIYCLGDCCDRGPGGMDIIREMIADKRVVYLCGNHEEMFTICMTDYLDDKFHNLNWWYQNGGQATYDAARVLGYDSILWYARKFMTMPREAIYINKKGQIIHLSHAGTALDYTNLDKHYYEMRHMDPLIWDRKHYLRKWPEEEKYKNHYIVHGHTPVPYMIKDFLEINRFLERKEFDIDPSKQFEVLNYSDGHKFNLDLASFISGTAALFDLDELKVEKYFINPEAKEDENVQYVE